MKNFGKTLILGLCMVFSYTIANAQDGLTPTTPVTKSLGAAHLIKVNATGTTPYAHAVGHEGNLYTWSALNAADDSPAGTAVSFLQTDLATPLGGTTNIADLFVVGVQWNTPGDYIIEVTEENQQAGQGNCTTKRRFFVKVTNQLDVELLALESNNISSIINLPADAAKLVSCSDGSGSIIDNLTNDFGSTTRYYRVNLNTGSAGFIPEWTFDFTLTTTSSSIKSVSVDGTPLGGFTSGDTAGTITVGASTPSILIAVEMANTAGTLQALSFSIDDETASITIGGTTYVEALAENGNNSVTPFTVNPMPNTSVISLD